MYMYMYIYIYIYIYVYICNIHTCMTNLCVQHDQQRTYSRDFKFQL